MARCGSCNKFVGYGDAEVEANVDVDEGTVSGDVELTLPCAECGDAVKSGSFDVSVDISTAVALHEAWEDFVNGLHKVALVMNGCMPDENDDIEHEYEVDGDDIEGTSRSVGKGRACKTFYGYHATLVVSCSCGAFEISVECDDDMQASHMDVLS